MPTITRCLAAFVTVTATATSSAQPSVSSGHRPTFVSVTAGSAHFCALDSTGDIYCWGDGSWGQLGNGSTRSSPLTPVRVASFQHFRQAAAGSTYSCALTDGGYAYCWGSDFSGGMGDANVRDRCSIAACATQPVPVAKGFLFDSLSVGFEHTCGLRDGRAYCWGRDDTGQLGVSGRMSACDGIACSRTPMIVSDSLRFSSIVARGTHTCGIAAAALWCWGGGDNRYQQLTKGGGADVGTSGRPVLVSSTAFRQVSVSSMYTCAVTVRGSVECFGANDRGRLGASSADVRHAVVAPPEGERFVRVSTGGSHTCALSASGTAYCWGSDASGALGGPVQEQCDGLPCSSVPVRVRLPSALVDVAAGGSMTCGASVDGNVYCWGGAARSAMPRVISRTADAVIRRPNDGVGAASQSGSVTPSRTGEPRPRSLGRLAQ
jgi:alpha-tubulin suppressor-like RCC1 family protein